MPNNSFASHAAAEPDRKLPVTVLGSEGSIRDGRIALQPVPHPPLFTTRLNITRRASWASGSIDTKLTIDR